MRFSDAILIAQGLQVLQLADKPVLRKQRDRDTERERERERERGREGEAGKFCGILLTVRGL